MGHKVSRQIALQTLVDLGLAQRVIGDGQVLVRGVRHDSRRVEPGDLFFALGGQVFDGADYSLAAAQAGAVAVASEKPGPCALPVLVVQDGLRALAAISKYFYGDPSASLPVVGITGTNGKTTVTYLVEQALQGLGHRPALAGTIEVRGPGGHLPATHTTPMADDLVRICRWALDSGATEFVTEVSSHGLAMHRVDGLRFEVTAFTNLSQDHLDFHGDLAHYGAAKARLFREFAAAHAVINVDDDFGQQLAQEGPAGLIRYSAAGAAEAELRVVCASYTRDGIEAQVRAQDQTVLLRSPLLGAHNLENLLCALGICVALGLPPVAVAGALSLAKGAPGRLQRVPHPAGVLVFVDYAHTPDALARVCALLREQTEGQLKVVFGCGGDRDRAKRPQMAYAVSQYADHAFLTHDNPRTEDPAQILRDIIPGLSSDGWVEVSVASGPLKRHQYVVEGDRAKAIALAVQQARPGDTLLIAGKGHENYQIVGPQRLPFDDVQEAQKAIAALVGGPS